MVYRHCSFDCASCHYSAVGSVDHCGLITERLADGAKGYPIFHFSTSFIELGRIGEVCVKY